MERERLLMSSIINNSNIVKYSLIVLLIVFSSIIYPQDKIELFPGDLNIKPFAANTLEPDLGAMFKFNSNELILSIGNSMDMIKYNCGNKTMTFGADLFTWTLLRKEDNFRFPVDAVDYLFGINFSYKQIDKNDSYGFRGRISHISAHFVDGHYDASIQHWREYINPQVYSREFIELIPFYEFCDLRVYAGLTYLFHVTPTSIHKDNYQLGFDYYLKNYFGENIVPFAGYNLTIDHLDKYSGNNSIKVGIKFGKPEGRGLSLQYHYYAGNSLHGEYYDFYEKYSSLGLNLDL
jgi:hypothetical protein